MIDIPALGNYGDQIRTISERLSTAVKASSKHLLDSGQEVRLCAARQAQANGTRLMSTVDALSQAPDASHASKVVASFLSESSQAYVDHMGEWTQIFLTACNTTLAPVLANLSTPASARA